VKAGSEIRVPDPGGGPGGAAARRGRPRDPEVDEAVLSATLDLLAEEGYARFTIDKVALRAGVAKTSLYRRWPAKEALVLDAIAFVRVGNRPDPPDTGSLRRDMLSYLRTLIRYRRAQSDAIAALASEILANRQLAEAFRRRLVSGLASGFRTIVERAVDRGELPASTDVELVASLPMALIHHRRVMTGEPADEGLAKRIADQFFSTGGVRPVRKARS
jgi:AcrR family transcriptional regulator